MNYFPLSDRRCVVSIIIWSKVHPKVISVQSISYRVWKPCIFAYMWSFIPCFLLNHMIFHVLFSWKHGIAKSTIKKLFTVIWTKMWFFWANCTIKRMSSFHELLLSHITFVAKLFVTLWIIKILLSFMNLWANSNKIGSWIDQFHKLLQYSFSSLCFQALAYSQNSHSNCFFPSWTGEMCLYNDLVMWNYTSCLFFVIEGEQK